MAKITIQESVLEDYKKACTKWEPTLLDLPLRASGDVLKYMITIYGLRGKKMFGKGAGESQFGPFKKDRRGDAEVKVEWRELETFHGNVVEEFAPVDYIDLVMGLTDPILGEKIKNSSTAAKVLMYLAASRGEHIAQAIFTGKRNPDGNDTEDIFDGFCTIIDKEVTGGAISADNGNLIKLSEPLSMVNTADVLKEEVLFKLDPFLRKEKSFLFCAPEVADMYNESYKASSGAVVYNTQYDQPYVEGSGKRLTILGLPEMAGQKRMWVTPKRNMLFGTDNRSDESFVDIMRKDHYKLSFASDMFFGAQLRTLDKRVFTAVELAD